ncbi:MAG TPA: hypothetical protein VJV75_07905 [Candidatus Polarisedimenticolia bacterium]|nr:hypothetical protein [Candidatus Polarisedimenticolia bacterium]
MPNRRVLLLAVILLTGTPLAGALDPAPVLDWYVDSVCPDDGVACTIEEAFYGQCRHRIDTETCRSEETRCAGESYCDPARGGCVCREGDPVREPRSAAHRPTPRAKPAPAAAGDATPGTARSG